MLKLLELRFLVWCSNTKVFMSESAAVDSGQIRLLTSSYLREQASMYRACPCTKDLSPV